MTNLIGLVAFCFFLFMIVFTIIQVLTYGALRVFIENVQPESPVVLITALIITVLLFKKGLER